MSGRQQPAPGPSIWRRPGAFFILITLAFLACGREESPAHRAVLELAEDTIRLDSGVTLFDILVRSGTAAAVPFTPDTVNIQQGDVVRFTTLDRHPHAITFEVAGLTPEIATFLERTGQLRSPPLITEGGSWVISFTDAPPGAYPFIDLSQDARGLIIVEQPVEPEPR